MKLNCWLILGTMLSTSLLAQPATNAPSAAAATNPPPAPPIETPAAAPAITNAPEAPALTATTNAPAAKAKAAKSTKKKSAKKKATAKTAVKSAPKKAPVYETSTVPLVAGPATVVASNVNVRGQASLKSEVVTKITKGQEVTVVEEIVRNNTGPTEPSAWAKILLPGSTKVWVNSTFLNADKTVKPAKLKLRSGPGENYSMLGIIKQGESVKELSTKGDWTQIEAPTNAYAFVAAQYLKQEAPGAIAANTPSNAVPEVPTTTATVAENTAVAPPPTEPPAITNAPATEAPGMTNAPTVAANTDTNAPEAKTEEPPPPRIVAHEGIVRGMTSIQAPSHFELVSADNGRRIDYLYTSSTNLDLRRYKGLHVVVTGEEGLDERWGNTPVLSIQRIQVVDDFDEHLAPQHVSQP